MSQEKVDKRKADKANRKQQLAKKKQKRILNIIIAAMVTIAFLAIVILAAGQLSGKFEKETTSANITLSAEQLSSLSEAMGLSTEETGETSDSETTGAASTETSADNSGNSETPADNGDASETSADNGDASETSADNSDGSETPADSSDGSETPAE